MINDAVLARKIEVSFFEETQKIRLIELLPQMTEEERIQVLYVIETAEKKMADDETYQTNLSALNKETENAMHMAVREETSNAREAFEVYDNEITETKLKEVEKEFEQLPDISRNKQK